MTKLDFLFALRQALQALPQEEREEHLNFYSEMIEDRVEEGLSEEEAVAAVGTVEEIAAQIMQDGSVPKQPKKKQGHAGRTVLLFLGSPVWLSLLIAAFAVVLSLYISLWVILISLWAVAASLFACGLAGLIAGVGFLCTENVLPGIAVIGCGLICGGLGILAVYGCKAATKGTGKLTKKMVLSMKKRWHHE